MPTGKWEMLRAVSFIIFTDIMGEQTHFIIEIIKIKIFSLFLSQNNVVMLNIFIFLPLNFYLKKKYSHKLRKNEKN